MSATRPAEQLIRSFRTAMVGADTVGAYLSAGHSLVICCKDCPRIIEWTPPELERRFAATPQLRLTSLVPRLSCTGDFGCGSKEVAVFPQLYDGAWPSSRAEGRGEGR